MKLDDIDDWIAFEAALYLIKNNSSYTYKWYTIKNEKDSYI